MTGERQYRHAARIEAKKARANRNQTESDPSPAPIDVERAGGWMPPADLREAALSALSASGDVALNLRGIDHLDASALQILLAVEIERKKQGRQVRLSNVSVHLREWFDYAGAVDRFSMVAHTDE